MDESWIAQSGPAGGVVRLIPRMRDWVNTNYPGTQLAITEYNWGALDHINGAVTQADVLGIFGREGLDLATLWGPPNSNQPGAFAFRMYRNYDGAHHTFGDTSVRAASADQDKVSIYAAKRSADDVLLHFNHTRARTKPNIRERFSSTSIAVNPAVLSNAGKSCAPRCT